MNIWVVNEGEHIPELTGKGRTMRGGMLANYFSNPADNDVTWWFSTFMHYEKKYYADKQVKIDLKPNLHLKMLHSKKAYKKNISFARIKYCKLLARELKNEMAKAQKPDVIYCSWPLIEEAYECVKYGKENNIPVVIDIRDFWPDIFTQPFQGIIKKAAEVAVNLLYGKKTRYVMQNADEVVGIIPKVFNLSEKYGRQIKECDHTVYLAYQKNDDKNITDRDKKFLNDIGIKENDFLVVYFGTVNNRVDNMNMLIEAAAENKNRNVKFVICGQGMAYDECFSKTRDMKNIIFTGLLNSKQICEIASKAKLGLLPYRDTDDFKNSLPNKFAEYLSYGLPILTSLSGFSKTVVEEKQCGMYFKDSDELNEKIQMYFEDRKLLEEQSQNALDLFNKDFSADIVYNKFLKDIENLADNKN